MVSVFIVEDERSLQFLYELVLTTEGFSVIDTASTGEEAIEKYKTFPTKPDIVIMDYRLPFMSGLEAAKKIFQMDKKVKIIFASADDTVKESVLSLGASSFKSKPFSNERLINNIKKALNQNPRSAK